MSTHNSNTAGGDREARAQGVGPTKRRLRKGRRLRSAQLILTAVVALLTAVVIYKQTIIQEMQTEASKIQAEASKMQAEASKMQAEASNIHAAATKYQADLTAKQAQDNLRNLRARIFQDILDGGDLSKKSGSLMEFAEHGAEVLPVIGQALAYEPADLHENTAEVVHYLFNVESVYPEKKDLREKLFQRLVSYLEARVPRLREGAVFCLIRLEPNLRVEEIEQVVEKLENNFGPWSYCDDAKVSTMQKVAHFLGLKPGSKSRGLLLKIANTQGCNEARIQAVYSLARNWNEVPTEREGVIGSLKELGERVDREWRENKRGEDRAVLKELKDAILTTISTIEGSKHAP